MSQKALFLSNKLSEPDGKFYVGTRDIPEPGPGCILVEVHATALNPADWKMADTGVFISKWPAVLGYDAAGVVKKVGDGVTTFTVGDKV